MAQQLSGDAAETVLLIHITSLRQMMAPKAVLGRVNATWLVANWVFVLTGTLAAGILGETIGLRATFFLAVGFGALSSLVLLASPVRKMRAIPPA